MRNVLGMMLVGAAVSSGCVVQTEGFESTPVDEVAPGGKDAEATKPVAWGSSDSPSIFAADLTYKVDELPREGQAASPPWAGSYWPVYQDGINYKWDGPQSEAPTTKFGKAFSVTGVEDAVSRMRGIAGASTRTACTENSQCKAEIGEACAKREGQTEGRCIPTWWGVCHAWGPASILVPEPQHPVTHNGVTFKVNDIKALVTLVHDSVENKFVSLRCDRDDGQGKIEYDEYGRPKQGDCMDTNPATLHLLLANYLGKRQQSFVMDRTFDDEVWNQPLRSFRVTKWAEVTAEQANALVGVTTEGGTTTTKAATLQKDQWQHLDPVAVTAGSKLKVGMTGDGDLYVKFGAQPTAQAFDCRPYENGSTETCELDVPAGQTQAFISVHGYTEANVNLTITSGGTTPKAYKFNANAKRFFEVITDLAYIGESASNVDGPLTSQIDRYTHTDTLHYVLEADQEGRLLGGEWLGDSKRQHPDFLWLPVRARQQSVAEGKIKYADVMTLLNASIATEESGSGQQRTVQERGTVTKGALKHYGPFNVAAGSLFSVKMTGTGDADLYVRKGSAPTLTSYDCRPYKSGSNETCSPQGPGQFYVAVHGYAQSSDYTLDITYLEPGAGGGGGTVVTPPATQHLNVSGTVAQGAFAYFTVAVTAGKEIVIRTTAPNDVDLYLQMDAQPTTESHVALAYTSSGNEELRDTPTANGTLHIGVHGYEASSFTLTTSDP
ncbi:MAG: pre-peptidase C-terminal domain-containing protein [Myxococcota bacterium]